MDNLSAEVSNNLRAVLVSSQYPIPVRELEREYAEITGKTIPLQRLGFSHFIQYLKSIPNIVKLSVINGVEVSEVVNSGDISHLTALIRRQKSGKRKKSYNKPVAAQQQNRPNFNHWATKFDLPNRSYSNASTISYQQEESSEKNYFRQSDVNAQKPYYSKFADRNPPISQNPSISQNQPASFPKRSSPVPRNQAQTFPKSTSPSSHADNARTVTINEHSMGIQCSISQPVTDPVATKKASDFLKKRLEDFLLKHRLGTAKCRTHLSTANASKGKGVKEYIGKVKIGDDTFSTYPQGFSTPEEAANDAIKSALEDLTLKLERTENSQTNVSTTANLIRRLHELIANYEAGMISTAIPDIYKLKFNESLPMRWLAVLSEDSDHFKIEPVDYTRRIIYAVFDDNYRRSRSSSEASSVVNEIEGESSSGLSTKSTSEPEMNMFKSDYPPLKRTSLLKFPENDEWDVFVTNVESTSDMNVRLIGDANADEFEILVSEMKAHYDINAKGSSDMQSQNINEGDLLAVQLEGCWHRVEARKIDGDMIYCLYVDCGDFDSFHVTKLWPIDTRFTGPPFQAIKCKLYGLDTIDDITMNANLTETVVGKVLIAKVMARDEAIFVKLYDSKANFKIDWSINDKLLRQRVDLISTPKLVDGINNVSQSHVSSDGTIYLSCSTDIMFLEDILDIIGKDSQYASSSDIWEGAIYLTSVEPHQRIKIASKILNSRVKVNFIDYGRIEEIDVCDILKLEERYSFLLNVPYQAVSCRLRGVPPPNCEWTPDAIKRLQDIIPSETELIANLTSISASCELPEVEMFKRNSDTNEIISVNQTLAFDVNLFAKNDQPVVTVNSLQAFNGNSGVCCSDQRKDLPELIFPSINSLSDIHVTLAANPFNFMFQLWEGGEKFDELVLDMHHFYAVKKMGIPVALSDIKDGDYYAVYYEMVWYRAKVWSNQALKENDLVMISLIDYGNQAVVSSKLVNVLDNKFRNLPPQVIKGSLGGIIPIHKDWQTEDCVRFRELIETKQFVALILGVSTAKDEKIFEVELIDTSNEEAVYVHKMLVEEKRAIYVPSVNK